MGNQPLPGTVWIQFSSWSLGILGPKWMSTGTAQKSVAGRLAGTRSLKWLAQLEPAIASLILASASSTVKVFGFCTGGNSLKVAANIAAPVCAA